VQILGLGAGAFSVSCLPVWNLCRCVWQRSRYSPKIAKLCGCRWAGRRTL